MKKSMNHEGLATDAIFLTIAKLVTSLISILITKLLAVNFSLYDYGTYSQAMLIVSTATSLSILGLTDGVNYFYNGNFNTEQKRKNINTIFLIQFIVGTICAVIILSSNELITRYMGNPALKSIYVYIMFSPMLSNLLAMYQVLFVSTGRAKLIAVRNLFVSIFKLFAVAVATLITHNVTTIFMIILVTDIIQVAFFSVSFAKRTFCVNPFAADLKIVRTILAYCLPLAIYILTNALCRDIDKYVISYFTDTETLAIYTNAAKMLPFDVITTSFATVMVPYITRYVANDEYEKSQQLYKNYLSFSYVTTWLIAFGAIVCAKDLMLILYDPKYLSGVKVFIVYILVDMIRFANVAVILRAKNKTFQLMLYSLGMLVANFILNIVFFQLWGMIGPAIATLVVTLVFNCAMLYQGAGIIRAKIYTLIDFKDMAKTICGMVLAGLVAVAVQKICERMDASYLITFILAYGVYAMIVFVLNIKKVLRILKNMNRIKAV